MKTVPSNDPKAPSCPACGRKMYVFTTKYGRTGTAGCEDEYCPSYDGGWPCRLVAGKWVTQAELNSQAAARPPSGA